MVKPLGSCGTLVESLVSDATTVEFLELSEIIVDSLVAFVFEFLLLYLTIVEYRGSCVTVVDILMLYGNIVQFLALYDTVVDSLMPCINIVDCLVSCSTKVKFLMLSETMVESFE